MALTLMQAHCNNCSGKTKHDMLFTDVREWRIDDDHEGDPIMEVARYYLVSCRGCDEIKMMVESSGPWAGVDTNYYPPSTFRRPPDWMRTVLPDRAFSDGRIYSTLMDLLREVYKGLENNMPRTAAMGIRAILESVMLDKVGDHKSFQANVAEFKNAGHISSKQSERIISVLDAGSAAIHRAYKPSKDDLIAMVDITEHVVESIYVHDSQIAGIRERTPPRQ